MEFTEEDLLDIDKIIEESRMKEKDKDNNSVISGNSNFTNIKSEKQSKLGNFFQSNNEKHKSNFKSENNFSRHIAEINKGIPSKIISKLNSGLEPKVKYDQNAIYKWVIIIYY